MDLREGWIDDAQPRPESGAQLLLDRFEARLNSEGGAALPDRCVPAEHHDLTLPSEPTPLAGAGCGGETRFGLPYEKEDGSQGIVTGCASCDLAIRWPRLAVA